MSLTLIRRQHGLDIDEHWIRADTWEELAQKLSVPMPERLPGGAFLVFWPDGHEELPEPPPIADLVKAWAAHGYRWAVISGTASKPRAVRGADQMMEEQPDV